MATFRFFTSVCDYGVLEVEADNYDEALDKAYGLDGMYHVHKTNILDIDVDRSYGDYGKV